MSNERAKTDLREAAQAVVDRWDTPLWKDVPATAVYINKLRAALAQAEPLTPAELVRMNEGWRQQASASAAPDTLDDELNRILSMTEEQLDAEISADGGDPDDYAERGRKAVEGALAAIAREKARASAGLSNGDILDTAISEFPILRRLIDDDTLIGFARAIEREARSAGPDATREALDKRLAAWQVAARYAAPAPTEPTRSQKLRATGFTTRERMTGAGGLMRDKFKDDDPCQQGPVQAAEMARQDDIAACMRIASDLRNNEVVRMSAAKCASAIQALASPTTGEQHEPVSLNLCLPIGVMFDAFGEPRERYVRVTLDGSHCVMRPSEGDTYLADAKQNGDDSSYTLADVYLSEREFDDIPDFDGF